MSKPPRRQSPDRSYWVVGWHAVGQIIRAAPDRIRQVLIDSARSDDRVAELRSEADVLGLRCHQVKRTRLDLVAGELPHQGVAVEVAPAPGLDEGDLEALIDAAVAPILLLVLDEVTDPRNFGACLRVADGAGVDGVVVPKRNSAPMSGVVHKAASGAAEVVPVFRVTNLRRALESLQARGIWLYGLALQDDSKAWDSVDLTQPCALVLGAEGAGLRRLTRETCDELLAIPMAGVTASLNVSVAAGVALYEARRQRGGRR